MSPPKNDAVKAAVGIGAALLVISLIAVGGKLMNNDDHGSQTPVVPQAPTPQPVPSCPSGMVGIPEGTFQMGSPEGVGTDNEHPQHAEHVAAFCMDATEVTVAAYRGCAGCTAPTPYNHRTDEFCNWGRADRDDHPINCVDWSQADAFCRSLGKRLPEEREWEYAARGTDAAGHTWPWGNEAPAAQLCWRGDGAARASTCSVRSFPTGNSPFNVFDMAGNVWEWTNTPHGAYSGAQPGGQLT